MSRWQFMTDELKSYSHYYSLPCPQPPEDNTQSDSFTTNHRGESLPNTTLLRRLDAGSLTHTLSENVRLDLDFVVGALLIYGPNLVDIAAQLDWQWESRPSHVQTVVRAEEGLYPFLEWVIYRPAARALPSVLSHLFKTASMPNRHPRCSTMSIVDNQREFGSTDIVHFWSEEEQGDHFEGNVWTVHEVKRARVLTVHGVNVLDEMYSLAKSAWNFRTGDECSRGQLLLFQVRLLLRRVHNLDCPLQAIDELAKYRVKHIVLSTENQYALVHLSDDSQLCMSRVYSIRGSETQAKDMAELVLFYAHATLTEASWLSSPSSVPIFRVTVPLFPPFIFLPRQGMIHVGHLVRSVKLSTLQYPSGCFLRLLSLRVNGYFEQSRHGSEIIIIFIRLTFLLFEASAVAKAVYGRFASDRLGREFDVYNALRPLQGVSIPILYGLYWNHNDGSSVLIRSHGGAPLQDFDALSPDDRFVLSLSSQHPVLIYDRHALMSHLIRIHWAGVQHNDIEPRNVLVSPSLGPIIIDFDSASLHHCCEDLSCGELSKLADRLGLDLGQFVAAAGIVLGSPCARLGTELSTTKRITPASTDILAVSLLSLLVMLLLSVVKYVES